METNLDESAEDRNEIPILDGENRNMTLADGYHPLRGWPPREQLTELEREKLAKRQRCDEVIRTQYRYDLAIAERNRALLEQNAK